MARPEPGQGSGTVLTFRNVTPGSRATAGFHRSNKVRLLESNQHPSGHSEAVKGKLDPHARPFSGLAWSSRNSKSNPRARDARARG